MPEIIDYTKIIQGSGDGYMDCYSCGVRMTITEVGKNRYEGKTMDNGYRVVCWCNKCFKIIKS